jgi:hypothetical protein
LEIPQQTRDSHIPTATTTTGYRGLDQHQTKINTKANTNNKTKVVYTDNLTHPLFLRPLPIAHAELLYVLSRQVIDHPAPHDSDFWAYPDFVRMRDVSKKDADLIAVSFTERYDQ